ncbi:MAG: cytoplasmic tRNA 2-thiolation protein 2 [Sclerophora amabilis]|nr:MAG: cytoplasmic tRNA 2-thiolation protein 2 [Sclerophora amabilis]
MSRQSLDGSVNGSMVLCKRCQELEATMECFGKYIGMKVVKRMDSYRVRNTADRKAPVLLLPISFGVSSITLLHLLDSYLKSQVQRTRKRGFSLMVVTILDSLDGLSAGTDELLERLRQTYPEHGYLSVPLADVSNYENILDEVCLGTSSPYPGEHIGVISNQEKLAKCLRSLPSATSRSDILNILRTRLIVKVAQEHGCEGIVWGDSTTRLAEKTLADAAKGRGYALPWQVADGTSPHGLSFNYPVRDLLKKEIVAYSELLPPPLLSLIVPQEPLSQVSASAKDTTIDDLMTQYFGSVEENFPSIVANVVRTSGKLKAASFDDQTMKCAVCKMPIARDSLGLQSWGGNQEGSIEDSIDPGSQNPHSLCYGCARSTLCDSST